MTNIVNHSTILSALTEKFSTIFGDVKDVAYFFSPGRINLIGEHTDYNGGYVFPASITIGTTGIARLRKDMTIKLFSENFPDLGVITFDLTSKSKSRRRMGKLCQRDDYDAHKSRLRN